MNENSSKRFRVVRFKAFNHEFDRGIIHVRHGKPCHIEDDSLPSIVSKFPQETFSGQSRK